MVCLGSFPGCKKEEYGSRNKGKGKYINTGDFVDVVMDQQKVNSYLLENGANCGIAYEVIPLDKPLGPSVILGNGGDSVELDVSGAEENRKRI